MEQALNDRFLRAHWGSVALLLFPSFFLIPTPLYAQANSTPTQTKTLSTVEVTSNANSDRRYASIAKMTISHEDIVRYGADNLSDALQRIPGVSVDRSSGKDAVIRLRGLGNGYTQLSINGVPVPRGFSIDSISPALVERIEVLRTQTADMSNQSIAGTINIILKSAGKKSQHDLKLSVDQFDNLLSPTISGSFSKKNGAISYGFGASLGVSHDRSPATSVTQTKDAYGVPEYSYISKNLEYQVKHSISVAPQIVWKPKDQRSLSLNALIQIGQNKYSDSDTRRPIFSSPQIFSRDILVTNWHEAQGQATAKWKDSLSSGSHIEVELTFNSVRRTSDSYFDAADEHGSPILYRLVQSGLDDHGVVFNGKYSTSIGDQNIVAMGWDGERNNRSENRSQTETSPINYPILNLSQSYDAVVSRKAVFAQDEWTGSNGLSGYLGARYEALTTDTRGNVLMRVGSSSSVFSPTAQLLWNIPNMSSDQIRVTVGRTFKAPTASQLVPRIWIVNQNSATTPNYQGNPNLVPELAWGLDIGYERYMSKDAFLGVNIYQRSIDRVILSTVFQTNGMWIRTPVNDGNANVYGIEFEAKGKLKELIGMASGARVRVGLSRNWSTLENVPGPGNRLDRQPRYTASIGVDQHIEVAHLDIGGNFVFESGGYTRVSAAQSTIRSDRRLLDVYVLYSIDKYTSLRLTVTNLLARDEMLRTRYRDNVVDQVDSSGINTFRKFGLVYEVKW